MSNRRLTEPPAGTGGVLRVIRFIEKVVWKVYVEHCLTMRGKDNASSANREDTGK